MSILNFIKKYRYDLVIALIIVLFTLLARFSWNNFHFLSSREEFRQVIESFGAAGPLILIAVIIVEVVAAPIPGAIPAITAGFIFGPVLGAIYTYIGNIVGSLIVFWLARKFGRYVINKLFREERVKKYEKAVARHENRLLAFYFIPIIPIDVITAVFGLSKIKIKKFIITIAMGYAVYSIGLNWFGDYISALVF